MGTHPSIDADVCIVGAGIVGLAHAFEARRRDLRVVVLERDEHPVGASVRNFGHVFIGAMGDGDALQCALLARERWLELGARAGLDVLQSGSLVIARHEDELSVMAGLARDERRGARLLTGAEAGLLAPIPTGGLVGALHCALDLRVDPRTAVPRLAALLERDPGALRWSAPAHDVEPGKVRCGELQVRAPIVIVCPGPDYRTLPAQLRPQRAGITRCKLQMLRVAAPAGRRYPPALLTGLSLLRYPGFTSQPGFSALQARLQAQRPEIVAAAIHLIVTQLPGGDLVVGDTHRYGDTPSPFGEERLDQLVLAEARRLLGVQRLDVRERWHGVYPTAPGDPFSVSAPMPGVRVVEVVAGVGMTTSFGLATRVIDELTATVSAPAAGRRESAPAAPLPRAEARSGYGS